MPQLVDQYLPAAELFGATLRPLRDAVLRAPDFDDRVTASESWLGDRLAAARAMDPIDEAARFIRRTAGTRPLKGLPSRAGLSERHWRRRFAEQTGLAPKLYAKITRLDAALGWRRAHPEMSWADVAQRGGYADQSHMLRDARALLGTTPATWLAEPQLGSHTLSHHLSAGAETPD